MAESVLIRFSDDAYGLPVGEDNEFSQDEVMRDQNVAMDFEDLYAMEFSDIKRIDDAFDILSHKVARNEKNVLAHIQRIRVAYQENKPRPLYAALTDLFLALDSHGREIKLRMLEGAKTKLVKQDYEELLTHIYGDADQLPYSVFCILGKGLFEGNKNLVQKVEVVVTETVGSNSLAEAMDYIEYGQLTEAKDCLSNAILEGNQDHEIHELLIDLLVKTKDKKGFLTMHDNLKDKNSEECLNLWNEAQRWFN